MVNYDLSKKGLIVVGTPRSGSHAITDYLFKTFSELGRYPLMFGEIRPTLPSEWLPDINSKIHSTKQFVFASAVAHRVKLELMTSDSVLDQFQLINLRRRDKVSQFVSLCLHELNYAHSPTFDEIKSRVPITVTPDRIQEFIRTHDFDKTFNWDTVLYYEDVIDEYNKLTNKVYTKNNYKLAQEEIISNLNLVKEMLLDYTYE